MIKNRTKIRVGIIVLVALLLIWSYVYYTKRTQEVYMSSPPVGDNQDTPLIKPVSSSSPDVVNETATWKVYRNHTYGIEIKYPRDWYIYSSVDLGGQNVRFDSFPSSSYVSEGITRAYGLVIPSGGYSITISRVSSTPYKAFSSDLSPAYGVRNLATSTIDVVGTSALWVSYDYVLAWYQEDVGFGARRVSAYIPHGDFVYSIILDSRGEKIEEITAKFDAFISTFRFLSADELRPTIHPLYASDFTNNRFLLGASHNVFVGKVIKQVGNRERGIGPETQFAVEVMLNIKGSLQGTVVVNQQGGYKDGVLYVVHGGDVFGPSNKHGAGYLLQPGSTYLLSTRYSEKENWYTLNFFPTASKLINQGSALTNSRLLILAENDQRVRELLVVYPDEILLDADIYHNNTRNSYQSLSVEEKTAIQARIASFNPPPPPPAPTSSATSTR